MVLAFLLMALLPALPSSAVAQATPAQDVIQTETHLVLVNVVVKDKHGKPVEDLKRDDFVLLDNNQQQKIAFFTREDAGATPPALAVSAAPMTFTNRPVAGSASVTAFLFDELNTSLNDQQLAKKDFLHYLRGLPADSHVAVFVLGDSLQLLHDFLQDMTSLLAAIEKHSNRANPEVAAADAPPATSNSLTGDAATTAQWDSFIQSSNQPYVDYTETVRALRTAEALETIAGHLQGIPGRKTLIWISGGFPIQLGLRSPESSIPQSNSNNRPSGSPNGRGGGGGRGPGGGGNGGGRSGAGGSSSSIASTATTPSPAPGTDRSFEDNVALAIRALNEADVAVYPVDARGLTVAPVYQADRSSMGKRSQPSKAVGTPDFNFETLDTLALETGGKSFHNINDLNAAIQDAAGDARVSYSLAFYPAPVSFDGTYHRLEVSVNRPGAKLQYRPGYAAIREMAEAPPLAQAIANPVNLAGIGFTVHLDPVEGGYKASITLDPRNVTLDFRDGKWVGSLQFLVGVGKVEQLTTIPLNLSVSMWHQIQEKGLVLGARIKTPPGTKGFSIGFRDIPSGAVGTLRVPL
jgi:VWFA-related protein